VEDALVRDLVPAVDHAYRTIPKVSARGIGGLSAGGYGALNIALHHPDVFSVAFSLTGYYTPEKTYDGSDPWGSDQARALNNPTLQADGQPVHIFIAEGVDDHDLLGEARVFDQVLAQHGMSHQLQVFPGHHSWDFWRAHLVDSLRYSFQYLPAPQQGEANQ
jgi:enterochelin esterase-like enzyme